MHLLPCLASFLRVGLEAKGKEEKKNDGDDSERNEAAVPVLPVTVDNSG